MNKTILVCGSDGYLGHALTLRLLKKGYKVIGIDDFRRRKNVWEMDSFSAIDIYDRDYRNIEMKKYGDFTFYLHSLEGPFFNILKDIFSIHKPDVIVNLAQQPSAPFSLKTREHAIDTTNSNLIGTLNILYAMKEFTPESQLIQIGSMGEYKPESGIDIPEGKFDFEHDGVIVKDALFPRSPGSFYHASKVASTYYIDCACRWWNFSATDIMQGVVFGNWTPEIEETGLQTRLDSDESFGTVVNRFIVQCLLDEPLTIFGSGNHKRGFLSLNDSIQCLMLAIENPTKYGEYRTWNQLDTVYSMKEVAEIVGKTYLKQEITKNVRYMHIDSPRAENTDGFYYKPVVDKLKKLGFKPTRTIEEEAEYIFLLLKNDRKRLEKLKNVIIPKIKWR